MSADTPPVVARCADALGRARLPSRRPSLTVAIDLDDRTPWAATFGFAADAERERVREVFLSGSKIGGDLEGLVDDACVAVSLLLQSGMTSAALARHLGDQQGRGAASVLGAALRMAAEIEEEQNRDAADGA